MKNKILLTLCLFTVLVLSAVSLSACGQNVTRNTEFEEYEKIATTVINTSLNKEVNQTTAKASSNMKAMAFTESSKDKLFTYLNGLQSKESADNSSFYQDVFEQSFYMPLICGDAIRQFHKSEKFYDIGIEMSEWNQYIKTVSQGTHKTSYCYSAKPEFNVYIVMDIDYKSESDFSFKALQFNEDLSDTLYLYGNSSREFLAISSTSLYESYVLYDLAGGEGYEIVDQSAIDFCYQEVAEEFTAIDKVAIKALQNNYKYTITDEQFSVCNEKYFGDNGPQDAIGWGYADHEQTVGYIYRDDKYVETLSIPSDMTTLNYDLYIMANIGKLVIPKTVTGIKIRQNEWDMITKGAGVVESDDFIDCPNEYFTIQAQGGDDMPYYYSIDEIVVEEGSTLFTVIDGNLWTADGETLLYVCDSKTATRFDAHGKSSVTESRVAGRLENEKISL